MKMNKTRPEILTVEELASLFANISNPKHFAFFITMYSSGLRVSEMLALKTGDIDGKRKLIRVRCGKNRKERYAPLTLAGYEALRYYWKVYRPVNNNNYLFPDYTKARTQTSTAFRLMLKKITKQAKICKNPTPHTLSYHNLLSIKTF